MTDYEPAARPLKAIEVKAFVPARDFERSKQFYIDLDFLCAWSHDGLAYFRLGETSFLLQDFYVAEHAANFMMHLLVTDADAWWGHVLAGHLVERYNVHAEPPEDRPWGIRDFVLTDPTGVLWRIGASINPSPSFRRVDANHQRWE